MRAVNLLPAAGPDKGQNETRSGIRTTKSIAVAAGLVLVVLAVVLGLAFTQTRTTVSDRQATLHGLEAEVAQSEMAATVTAAGAATMRAHYAAVTAAATGRTPWDGLLGQLSRVMPAGAWLESVQTTAAAASVAPTSASSSSTGSAVVTSNALSASTSTTPTAGTFTVTGFARSQAVVPRVLERLALVPALSDVSLQTTQRSLVGSKAAVQFTINANVRSAGGIG